MSELNANVESDEGESESESEQEEEDEEVKFYAEGDRHGSMLLKPEESEHSGHASQTLSQMEE